MWQLSFLTNDFHGHCSNVRHCSLIWALGSRTVAIVPPSLPEQLKSISGSAVEFPRLMVLQDFSLECEGGRTLDQIAPM